VLKAISEAVSGSLEWLTERATASPTAVSAGAFRALAESQFVIRCVRAYDETPAAPRTTPTERTAAAQREGEFVFAYDVLMDPPEVVEGFFARWTGM